MPFLGFLSPGGEARVASQVLPWVSFALNEPPAPQGRMAPSGSISPAITMVWRAPCIGYAARVYPPVNALPASVSAGKRLR